MVRLVDSQIRSLTNAAHKFFGDSATIWLYGSRVDDKKRGGDIDLYIETDLTIGLTQAKLQMRGEIWKEFGDQKIDILIRSRSEAPSPIHIIAKETGVIL